jgi:hypothetical protein
MQEKPQFMTAGSFAHWVIDKPNMRSLGELTASMALFTLHCAEMYIAMLLGMVAYGPARLALAGEGCTAFLHPMSIASEVGMGAFMAAPMVLWMRVRGCAWRRVIAMAGAMLGPWIIVLLLSRTGLPATLPWLPKSGPAAMSLGMLAFMLYRRDCSTTGYPFTRWPDAPRQHGVVLRFD